MQNGEGYWLPKLKSAKKITLVVRWLCLRPCNKPFVPSCTLRVVLLQGEGEEELHCTRSVKIPPLFPLRSSSREMRGFWDTLFLSLDASIAAGSWQGRVLRQTKPCLDVYSSVWPSVPAGLRIHIQNSFGPPKVKTASSTTFFLMSKLIYYLNLRKASSVNY